MEKIIRTPTKAEGGITPQEKADMDLITQKWIKNAFKTDKINEEKITKAIEGLYKAAKLKKPRVVIVSSPYVMALAYGLSAGVWYLRKNKPAATDDATRDATDAATYAATDATTYAAIRDATYTATLAAIDAATDAATYDATYAATRAATDDATGDATRAATRAATYAAIDAATDAATYTAIRAATDDATYAATLAATDDATYAAIRDATYTAIRAATLAATDDATRDATDAATYAATHAATDDATGDATHAATDAATYAAIHAATDAEWLLKLAKYFGGRNYQVLLNCCLKWTSNYQCGNMWSSFLAWTDACKNILKLTGLKCWDDFEPYLQAGTEGGFRMMHEKFCIVSDFPEILKVNKNNQAHCETGPSHRWRDGFEIYSLNGITVPAWLVKTPAEKIDPTLALKETNTDVQREIIRKMGAERMLKVCDAKTLDDWNDPNTGYNYKLMNMTIGNNIRRKYLYFEHASMKGIFYTKPVPPETTNAIHGRAWMLSMIERNKIKNVDSATEAEIIANLPLTVS